MHLEGSVEVEAPRPRAWEVLSDPNQIAACLPGDPAVEIADERHMRVSARVGNFLIRTTVVIDVEVVETEPPSKLAARAQGSVMGSAIEAIGGFDLVESGTGRTTIQWQADVTLGGGLGGFEAMVEAPARSEVERTLACLKARIEAPEPQAG